MCERNKPVQKDVSEPGTLIYKYQVEQKWSVPH